VERIKKIGAGQVPVFMIYPGEKKMQTEDHIDIWPFDFFCEILAHQELWEETK
jgi:hypothetical protein